MLISQVIYTRQNKRRDNFGSFNPEEREVQKEKYQFFAFEFDQCEMYFRINCAFKALEKTLRSKIRFTIVLYEEKKRPISS